MAFLDWGLEHGGKVLSGIVLAAVISWQAYPGMYDWRAVTTSDVLSNPCQGRLECDPVWPVES